MEERYERRWWKEGNDVRVDEGLRRDIRVAIHVYSEEGGRENFLRSFFARCNLKKTAKLFGSNSKSHHSIKRFFR